MRGSKILLATVFALMMAMLLVGPVFARHSNYSNSWIKSGASCSHVTGSWNDFEIWEYDHASRVQCVYTNEFSTEYGKPFGYSSVILKIKFNIHMFDDATASVLIRIYSGLGYGYQVEITFDPYWDEWDAELQELDGTPLDPIIENQPYSTKGVALKVAFGVEAGSGFMTRDYQVYGHLGTWDLASQTIQFWNDDYACDTGSHFSTDQFYMVHEVDSFFGNLDPDGRWFAEASISNIGLRYDCNEDGYCGIDDPVLCAENYGEGIEDSELDWFAFYYIFDAYCDGFVGIDDIIYYSEQFGKGY